MRSRLARRLPSETKFSKAPELPSAAKSLIASFSAKSNEQDPLAFEAPEANAHEFHAEETAEKIRRSLGRMDRQRKTRDGHHHLGCVGHRRR